MSAALLCLIWSVGGTSLGGLLWLIVKISGRSPKGDRGAEE